MNELTTQDKKLKIVFNDESVKVWFGVEDYVMKFKSNEEKEVYKIEFIYDSKSDIVLEIIKGGLYKSNFVGKSESDGVFLRSKVVKKVFYHWTAYGDDCDGIKEIYYEGNLIYTKKDGYLVEEKGGE